MTGDRIDFLFSQLALNPREFFVNHLTGKLSQSTLTVSLIIEAPARTFGRNLLEKSMTARQVSVTTPPRLSSPCHSNRENSKQEVRTLDLDWRQAHSMSPPFNSLMRLANRFQQVITHPKGLARQAHVVSLGFCNSK